MRGIERRLTDVSMSEIDNDHYRRRTSEWVWWKDAVSCRGANEKTKKLMEIRENKSIEHEKGFFPFSSFYNFPFPHTIFHPLVGVPCLSSSLCNTHPHIICINNYLRRHIQHFSDFHHSQIQTLRPPYISHCPFHCLFHSTTQSIKPFFIFSV